MSTSDIKSKSCEVKSSDGSKVKVDLKVDFSNATRDQLMEWALSNRIITGQRPWRELTPEEIRESVDGKTFKAEKIGHKVESRSKQVQKTVSTLGVSTKVAELLIDNPEKLDEILSKDSNEN